MYFRVGRKFKAIIPFHRIPFYAGFQVLQRCLYRSVVGPAILEFPLSPNLVHVEIFMTTSTYLGAA